MSDEQGDRHWRLHFAKRIVGDDVFNHAGEIADTWVESDDPQRIKALVARGTYSSDEPLRLSLLTGNRPRTTLATVICTPASIAAWNPAISGLPDGELETAANRPVRITRLSIVRDVHVALGGGVTAGMIGQDEADRVVMLVRSLLNQRR